VTEFRLLGPVETRRSGCRLDSGPPQQRLVLAALLADAGRLVSAETLIDRVWGEDPPPAARRGLHVHIARIRRLLSDDEQLVYSSGGYLLQVDPDRVDLHRFRRLVSCAAEPGAERLALLREALGLWRGTPVAGLPGPWAAGVRDIWSSRHMDTVVAWADAEVDAGNPGPALDALTEMSTEHPLVEPVTAALMRALYAAGRSADALDCYARMRRRLVDELGVEPGPELQAVQGTVLRGEPRPQRPPPALAAGAPAQLPSDVAAFVGRRAPLDRLTELSADRGLIVVSGMAGVGKTALAVHWATTMAAHFRDGQLYVNLRGYGGGGPPVRPAEAIRGFLEAFDVPVQHVPVTASAQVSLYRRLVAGRRMLVLLDNACDADQVRPLLAGGPGCVTLVTSRNLLPALVVTDGAYPLTLDPLSIDESRQLLAAWLGAARVAAEPRRVAEIIDRCARLPLAMTLVATRAAAHQKFALAALAQELRDADDRLDALSSADPAVDVRTALSWSYRRLSEPAAALFRLLGGHRVPNVTTPAAAALLGVTARRVAPLLAELADAHLIVEQAERRFGLHDLLRAYAAEKSRAVDSERAGRTALHRVLDHYLHTANAADGLLYPHRDEIALDPPRDGAIPQRFDSEPAATAWFAAERAVLLAAVDQAADDGFPAHALRLALLLVTFLDRHGYWHQQIAALQRALEAARLLGDRAGEAHTLRVLGLAHARLGRHAEADTHARQALMLHVAAGDRVGQARVHRDLANICWRQDRRTDALHHLRRLMDLSETAGLRAGSAFTLYAQACVHFLTGDHGRAVELCRASVAAYQEIGDRVGEAVAWEGRGHAHHARGYYRQALICHRRALRLRRELGDRYLEAESLLRIGDVHEAAGRAGHARTVWLSAYDILSELDHPEVERVKAKIGSTRAVATEVDNA
jgi:DNA-binding SARP family transcriptional activator/tetratricopeptide (TPR) repeat protein